MNSRGNLTVIPETATKGVKQLLELLKNKN